ncbi:MAG TPA: DNA polymerase domain-containing protein, partial [Candidatus Deferrimicrobium sp.]
ANRITEETGMPIALEGVYNWIAFLPSKRNRAVAVPNRFAGTFSTGEIKVRGIALRRSDTPLFVAALQRDLLKRMAKAKGLFDLQTMLPELREVLEDAVSELRAGHVPVEELAIARRLSKAPDEYVANTVAAAVTRELCGRGVPLRPGSKIRYLLADGKGRAMGFLDGNETPNFARYEEMLREAEEELTHLIKDPRLLPSPTGRYLSPSKNP